MQAWSTSSSICASLLIPQLDCGVPDFVWRSRTSVECHCNRDIYLSVGLKKTSVFSASVQREKNASVLFGFSQKHHVLHFQLLNGVSADQYPSMGFCFASVCCAVQDERGNGEFRIKKDEEQPANLLELIAIETQKKNEEDNEALPAIRGLALGLRSATNADHVQELIQDMEFPLSVYSSVIRALGKEKLPNAALALFQWLKRKKKRQKGEADDFDIPNVYMYNSLVGALKASGQYKMIDTVMEEMLEEGISPNIITFNTLMCIYLEQGRFSEALNILPLLQRQGLTPTLVTYSTVLLTYQKMGDARRALNFFRGLKDKYKNGEFSKNQDERSIQEFQQMEHFVTRICYRIMRKWLAEEGEESRDVLMLLREMNVSGTKMGLREYEHLIQSCRSHNNFLVAKALYEQMREKEMEISVSVCNSVIWVLSRGKKWWAALEIFEEMLDKGPEPNNSTRELIVSNFNVLLSAARRRGIWKWAVSLLDKMQEKGLKPSNTEWNSALLACGRASQTAAAVDVFQKMVEHGEKPDSLSYGALLSALEKGQLYEQALQVWEHMQRVGVKSNLVVYTIMVSVYSRLGKFGDVHEIIHQMLTSGIKPTVMTYNEVIKACADTGRGDVALEWLELMRAKNISPNPLSYEKSIEALATEGKWELAFNAYLKAQEQKVWPSAKAYDAVVGVCQAHNATIDMGRLGLRPRERRKLNNNGQT